MYVTPPFRPSIAKTSYYSSIESSGHAPTLRDIQEVISRTHRPLGYNDARDGMFQLVFDTDGDDSVADIYTGRIIRGIGGYKDAFSAGMNTEHTWPQSLGATGIGRSDLHQLMPSDSKVNSRRGNMPYGEVVTEYWHGGEIVTSRQGLDSSGHEVFEPPNRMKGDIARALLYFYTRYNHTGLSRFSTTNFAIELPFLLKWHVMDPVDATEMDRNDAVYSIQGNRNPFIDNPDWVNTLDFSGKI